MRQGVNESGHGAGRGGGGGEAAVTVVGRKSRGGGGVVIVGRRVGLYRHAGGLGGGSMRERRIMNEGFQKGG